MPEVTRFTKKDFFYNAEPVTILEENKEAQHFYEVSVDLIRALNSRFQAVKHQPENTEKIQLRNARVMDNITAVRAVLDQLESQVK